MAYKEPITADVVRQLLRYDPESGKLFWLPRKIDFCKDERSQKAWNSSWAGKEAFTSINDSGYFVGRIFAEIYRAHRVIWLLVHGKWPDQEIDHIDGHRQNNRISNLRDATKSENLRNQTCREGTTGGFTGVSFYKRDGLWRAYITPEGPQIHLGYFNTKEEAVAARQAANIKYGFTARHGKPAETQGA